jgi:hypothetical protein
VEAPKRRSTLMTQRGTLTANEDRRHPLPAAVERCATDGVYPPRNQMQTSNRDAMGYRAPREAEPDQLGSADHTVLQASQRPGFPTAPPGRLVS